MDKNKLVSFNKRKEDLASQLLAEAKQLFKEEAASLFEENSALASFSWTQYTPYFNDGDECVFRARTYDPQINGNYDSGSELGKKVMEFLKEFDSRTLEDMFGDHAEITVTKKEISVVKYEHE